ncbi:MAG: putative DNA binding domain-containing protein [Acetatifactor sp.]|nr:putative DNA binding domain-containing protein [Acetatifactor sp.]
MDDLKKIVQSLLSSVSEEEWYEYKENWYDAVGIGEYISSLSNAAAMCGEECAYLIWGVNNATHEVVGTTFNYHMDVKNEPLQHFLARQVTPDVGFSFAEITMKGKRVVVLTIPAARQVPTSFNGTRYLRIGSSKVNLNKYPERESQLFDILRNGFPTIENTQAYTQELTFRKLFLYYEDKGITLNKKTFKKNLGLLCKDGSYNLLAQLLSDNSQIPIRVSIFRGSNKASKLYSVREFGNNCVLVSLDKVIEYGDVLNIMQADEAERIVTRKEVPLFDTQAFKEAIINAFVHNLWVDGNAPMITVYSDRLEILSRGKLPPKQTIAGFYLGESVPVNQKLSDIFLQLHISERSGRGVPKITDVYGREAFEFRENSIVVTIPFNKIDGETVDKVIDKTVDKVIDKTREGLSEVNIRIIEEMRYNPGITQPQLAEKLGVGKTTIQKNISYLKKNGFIDRVGSNKTGVWKIL